MNNYMVEYGQVHGGITPMISYDQCFKSNEVKKYAATLVMDYKYKDYTDLSHADKCEFVAHLMKAAGTSANEAIIESNHFDQAVETFRSSLINSDKQEDLLLILQNNAIDYYEHIMIDLFNEAISGYISELQDWKQEYGQRF